jgi:stalled ribosome rescue protein Dom34
MNDDLGLIGRNPTMKQMAVWMDQNEARVFQVDAQTFDEKTVERANGHVHRHPKDMETRTHNHPDDEHRFFRDIAHLLAGAQQILVLGPSVTKAHFVKYASEHDKDFASKVVGVESAEHPTDRQIVAHVRHHFHVDPSRRGVGT